MTSLFSGSRHSLVFTQLSNHLFEELAMDVYDEVDRRETDAGGVKRLLLSMRSLQHSVLSFFLGFFLKVWLATQNHSTLVTETTVVPFLPVNPEYSSTRNQACSLDTATLRLRQHAAIWSQLTRFRFLV